MHPDTKAMMQFTQRVHREFQGRRRVLEATYRRLEDWERRREQIDSINPGEILELPDLQRVRWPDDLWAYWLIMAALGPPTVLGVHCALRDRPELRQLCASAGRVPSQDSTSRFIRKMGENIQTVRPCLQEQAEIATMPPLSAAAREIFDTLEVGIMLLEQRRDQLMDGETTSEALRERPQALDSFMGIPPDGENSSPDSFGRRATALAELRNRIARGEALTADLEAALKELAAAILPPMPTQQHPQGQREPTAKRLDTEEEGDDPAQHQEMRQP